METFNNPAANWTDWEQPWAFTNGQPSGTISYNNWLAEGNDVVLGQDLVPQSADGSGWEASCAAGDFNSYAAQFAQNLVSYGAGRITLRLGIEANGKWEADYVGTDPSDWDKCFDNEVASMKASAPNLLIAWDPNACYSDAPNTSNPASWYPGNAYVNIIGADAYDTDCSNGETVSQEGWAAYAAASFNGPSLDSIQALAELEGKPTADEEWGVVNDSSGPAFVNGLASFLNATTTGWAFQTYFDDGDDGIPQLSSSLPDTVAAYTADFVTGGGESTPAATPAPTATATPTAAATPTPTAMPTATATPTATTAPTSTTSPPASTAPAAPTGLKAAVKGTSVTLSWHAVAGATSYVVRVAGYAIQVTTLTDNVYADDTTTATSLSLRDLPTNEGNGNDYWWGVAAVNSAGETWDAQTAAGNANAFVLNPG